MSKLSKPQVEALDWLTKRGGDGMFNMYGLVLAMGQVAPHMRSTWNALRDARKVEFYKPEGKGRGRVRIVKL